MCGRFSQALPAEQMVQVFGAADRRSLRPEPSWNVAPSQSPTIVARDPTSGHRVLVQMEWGWLAPWENVPDYTAMRPINARCETVGTSRLFGKALRSRRCLVPVDAWYEWVRVPGGKQPYALARTDGVPLALGAIWESWSRIGADRRMSFALVTTRATEELACLHDRMPLVLEPADWRVWLGEAEGEHTALMRPAESGRIKAWPVGRAVGNPRNNGPELLAAA